MSPSDNWINILWHFINYFHTQDKMTVEPYMPTFPIYVRIWQKCSNTLTVSDSLHIFHPSFKSIIHNQLSQSFPIDLIQSIIQIQSNQSFKINQIKSLNEIWSNQINNISLWIINQYSSLNCQRKTLHVLWVLPWIVNPFCRNVMCPRSADRTASLWKLPSSLLFCYFSPFWF